MKKIKWILFSFLFSFFLINNVEATFTCDYECADPDNNCANLSVFSLEIDPDNETIGVIYNTGTVYGVATFSYTVKIDDSLKEQWFNRNDPTTCSAIHVCSYTTTYTSGGYSSSTNYIYNLYADDGSAKNDRVYTGWRWYESIGTSHFNTRCYYARYSGDESSLTPAETSYDCTTFDNGLNKINNLYVQIKNLGNQNASTQYTQVNQEIKKLQTFCQGVYASFTYKSTCVQDCTHLESELAAIKDANGIADDESKNANCSLSSRLVKWIMKFVNWMRYIVPILLIILSVLDYIKAIAADSEDEIKKVTSKFIKRLIVSVLIFIVPLALEFILGIFGVDTNNFCL